jgi:hypothetical protein
MLKKPNNPKLANTVEEAVDTVERLLSVYNFNMNDSKLDDYVWVKHVKGSKLFNVGVRSSNSKQVVFVNSVTNKHKKDSQTLAFINNLVTCCNNYMTEKVFITKSIKYDDEREVNWVFIIVNYR